MKMEASEMKKLLLVLAVLSSSCVCGMTEAEFAELKKKAASGNAEAMCDVGSSYRNGVIVPKNLDLAAEWTQKAASNGSERAMGACYEFGYGVEKDMTEAERWYRKSAERGSQMSQIWIATTLYQRKDFRGAAEQYENFVRRFPESVKVDRARFMTGSCFVKLAENTADKMIRDGYYAKAVQFYEEGYEHARDSKLKSQCGYWAADVLERLGMYEEMNLWVARLLPELPKGELRRWLRDLVMVAQKKEEKLPIGINGEVCVSNWLPRCAAGDKKAKRAKVLAQRGTFNGVFGKKFGDELPTDGAMRVTKFGVDFYRVPFEPAKKTDAFTHYYVWLTPVSHKIFEIEARSDSALAFSREEFEVKDEKGNVRKYQTATPEIIFALEKKYCEFFIKQGEAYVLQFPEEKCHLSVIPDLAGAIADGKRSGFVDLFMMNTFGFTADRKEEEKKIRQLKDYNFSSVEEKTRALVFAESAELYKLAKEETEVERAEQAKAAADKQESAAQNAADAF